VTAVDAKPLVVADAETGKGVWIGRIEEHGQPAWAAITVSNSDGRIDGIDALIRRKEYGAPYAEPEAAPQFAVVPQRQRTSRAAMIVGAQAFQSALIAKKAPEVLAESCAWTVNGQSVGPCAPPFAEGAIASIGGLRDVELLAADESRGLVAYRMFEDLPALGSGYPRTYQVLLLLRFVDGKVERINSFTSELPYGMKPHR
jgi:hypothetical protein